MKKLLPLFIVIALSGFANWLDLINVLTYVGYELKANSVEVGAVAISMLLPHVLFGRVFANWALRLSFQRILFITLFARGVLSLALVFAPNITSILVILFLRAMMIGFMQPALSAYVSQIGSRLNIAGIINMILTSSKIIAPAIGGVFSITLGETFAFTVSGLMALAAVLFVFWIPLATGQHTGHKSTSKNVSSPWMFLLLFAMPIVFIDGLSLLFTNVIPYSFSFYNVPKITLSISLTVSAVGNLLMGAVLVKRGKSNGDFPVTSLLLVWLSNTLLFGALIWVMPYQAVTVFIIPGIFFFLSIAKTLYDVSLNGYIFQQTKHLAAKLSALRQSVSAGAGITLTIAGVVAINDTPPTYVLSVILVLSLCSLLLWVIAQKQPLQNSNSVKAS